MSVFPSRCQHIKVNGTQCGSPALRRNQFCFFHKRFQTERLALNQARARRRAATLDLPVLEDANSIQVSLMQIMRLLALGHLDAKTAGLMLYALQTASLNLHRTNFEPNMHHIVLDPKDVDETPLGAHHLWDDEDFEDEDDEEARREEAAAEAKQRDLERDAGLWRSMMAEQKRMRQEEREQEERVRMYQEGAELQEARAAAARARDEAASQAQTGARRPPGRVDIDEVREQIRKQARKALIEMT